MLFYQPGIAVNTVTMRIGDVHAPAWSAHDVTVSLETSGQNTTARVLAARLVLSETLGPLERVTITCRNPVIEPPRFRCRNAQVAGMLGKLGKQSFVADIAYESSRESLTFAIRGLKFAGATIRVDGRWLQDAIELHAAIEHLTVNNAAGTLATDKLGFKIDAHLKAVGADWDIAASVRSANGQAYKDPVFVDFSQFPLAATVSGRWTSATNLFRIDTLTFDQTGIVEGSARGEVGFGEAVSIKKLSLNLASLQFPGAYTALLQPFLLDTAFKDLETSGRLSGTLAIANNAPTALDLTIDGVSARDKSGTLGIGGLRGQVVWSSTASKSQSHISWDKANAYGLIGGAARIDFKTSGANFELSKPAFLPVFDGGLQLHTLRLEAFGSPRMSLGFDAQLRPISMPLLCKAFGWPEFPGTLAGRIPQVSYDNAVLSVGGVLDAQAFGGQLVVKDLKLRDPLGQYPRLNADVTLRGLDLEAVTGTFSFGMITGKLDGDVHGLELFRWEPVKMDARLYTPSNDKSRHLISQRAVKNLSSIGGGGSSVAAALSSGFLRFFENFRYRTLGLSCRLDNDICVMDGISPATGGAYYIVQGSGVPRIDIIGNARRVDWPRLVEQLKAIANSEGPVIQ